MLNKAYSKQSSRPSVRSVTGGKYGGVSAENYMERLSKMNHQTLADAQQSRAFNVYRAQIRELSPVKVDDTNKYETTLPNRDMNYSLSPAAKRAGQDGSLDPNAQFNRTFNRKLKMRDTFTNIFPLYNHGQPTCYQSTNTHVIHEYPKADDLGKPTHAIDRTFTHKMDEMKVYTESMLKIQNMRRF